MIIKYGKIAEVEHDTMRAKVDLIGENLQTGWLHALVLGSKTDAHSFPMDQDTTVAIMTDKHCETGVILGAIYSKSESPALNENQVGVVFESGDEMSLDRDERIAKLVTDIAELQLETSMTVEAGQEVTLTDTAGAKSGVKAGKVQLAGAAEPILAILSDLITVLSTHTHMLGGVPTTPPVQAPAITAVTPRLIANME